MEKTIKILSVVGARPNFIKIAPFIKELRKYKNLKLTLVHTGQHYDFEMSQLFFNDLNIPKPDYNLSVGSGSFAFQMSEITKKMETIILKEKPDLVVVAGDVNSTLAGALVARTSKILVAHIEAGLRSFDNRMIEEMNRILTDRISDFLFVTEPSAKENLLKEGISNKRIFFVGNIMIDSLKAVESSIKPPKYDNYVVLTLHRSENVDNKKNLKEILEAIIEIQEKIEIVWPIHPRTSLRIKEFGLEYIVKNMKNIRKVSPLGYIDMLSLNKNAKFIMTDSGGIQEEATFFGVPCLTIRDNTERPITVKIGTNIIAGTKKECIIKEADKILMGKIKKGKIPKYWDGRTAERILKILNKNLIEK
jgi:UDP-N-acetylglucosamine 2-epimerase (non-hydrolysing)